MNMAQLNLKLTRNGRLPLYRQLYQQIQRAILAGTATPGSALPSSRRLAAELGVARITVTQAYEQLLAEGYVVNRPGRACLWPGICRCWGRNGRFHPPCLSGANGF
ncbi:MAG: winged helix-turn-helix domain-containing protein [Chloroflexi bacterium]|nr:winged helix-turn-helix domain-containing protein [Chloroflexota bacterium]